MTGPIKPWIVVLPLLLASCGGEEDTLPVWQSVEVARIGSLDDPATTFYRVSDIARDRAGRLYVADAGNSRIRVYDRDGDHVRDMGRPGSGPGEFEHLRLVTVINDTIYALHSNGFRAAFFDTSGVLLRTVQAATEWAGAGVIPQLPSWQFTDGTAVAGTASAIANEPLPFLRTDRYGAIIDTLTVLMPEDRGTVAFASEQRRASTRDPFARPGRTPVFSRDGSSVQLTVHPDDGLAPGEFRLVGSKADGSLDWERVYETTPIRYSSAKADSLIEAAVRPVDGMITEAEFRSAVTVPTYEYPAQEARFDEQGGIWVQIATREGDMAEWLILTDRGIPRRRVRLPVGAKPQIMTGDTAFALESDDLGVQYVVEYRLVEQVGQITSAGSTAFVRSSESN